MAIQMKITKQDFLVVVVVSQTWLLYTELAQIDSELQLSSNPFCPAFIPQPLLHHVQRVRKSLLGVPVMSAWEVQTQK